MIGQLSFTHQVLLGSLVDATLGMTVLAVLTRSGSGRITAARVGLALVAAASGAALQVVLVDDDFGKLHVLYLYVFVTVPVLGAVVLTAAAVRLLDASRAAAVGSAACVALAGLGYYATHIEPFWLRTDRAHVEAVRVNGSDIRVGVLSDLQATEVGAHEREVIRLLMAAKPDLILISGDLFQSDGPTFDAAAPAMRDLLDELRALAGFSSSRVTSIPPNGCRSSPGAPTSSGSTTRWRRPRSTVCPSASPAFRCPIDHELHSRPSTTWAAAPGSDWCCRTGRTSSMSFPSVGPSSSSPATRTADRSKSRCSARR